MPAAVTSGPGTPHGWGFFFLNNKLTTITSLYEMHQILKPTWIIWTTMTLKFKSSVKSFKSASLVENQDQHWWSTDEGIANGRLLTGSELPATSKCPGTYARIQTVWAPQPSDAASSVFHVPLVTFSVSGCSGSSGGGGNSRTTHLCPDTLPSLDTGWWKWRGKGEV